MRTARAFAALATAALLASGCTGTSTPSLPTVLVVARTTAPPSLALVAVDLTATSRALRLVAPTAFTFDAAANLVALDATPRDGVPTAAWVLASDAAGANATLHRFDLAGLVDDPTTTVDPVGAPFVLTNGDRAWGPELTLEGPYAGPVCPQQLVVGGPAANPNRYVALWDLCAGEATADGRVHVVDLEAGIVTNWSEPAPYDAVGIRPGVVDPATFTTVRVAIDELVLETRRFAAPATSTGVEAKLPAEDVLLDLSVARGTWWTLVRPASGDPEIRGFAPDVAPVTRPALDGATRLFVGGGPGAIAFAANQAQVVFADVVSTPTSIAAVGVGAAPAAVAVTVEANDYAVVATTFGTLCALDARVAATSPGCEFVLPAPGLSEARFLTWTYAAPPAP